MNIELHPRAWAEKQARDAILFRRIYPPRYDLRPASYFGGLPTLPDDLVWPVEKVQGRGMSFLGQIDCSALPGFPDRRLLPRSGVLFFFADTDFGSGGREGQVLFHEGSSASIRNRPAPAHLMPCYGASYDQHFKWLNRDDPADRIPRTFPKWAVQGTVARSYPDREVVLDEQRGSRSPAYVQACRDAWAESLTISFGEAVERYLPRQPVDELWRPDEDFPYAWILVEIFAAQLLRRLSIARSFGGCDQVERSARTWVARSRLKGGFTALEADDREAFWAWVQELSAMPSGPDHPLRSFCLNGHLQSAFFTGPALCLAHSAEAGALIPPMVVELLRYQHAIQFRGGGSVRHQMLGHARALRKTSLDHRDDLLLMQFDCDDGIIWMWGEMGVLQFWIREDDLAEKRFERAVMTLEGG